MKILVINCGSSSLKYQLIDSDSEAVIAKGLVERIGIEGSCISHTTIGREKLVNTTDIPNHTKAVSLVLSALTDENNGCIKNLDEIDAIGHRVVHGGEKFKKAVVITDDVMKDIEELSDLAPLHNPANLIGIKSCMENMPGKVNVAVFDTAFHQTMPEKAYMYGLPYEYYEKYKVRRYGFHGTSHDYVSKQAAVLLNKDIKELKIVVCHLGNGASVSAVKNGECVDTSMGLTPLEGLIMGTRSGDLDPAILDFICAKEKLSSKEMNTVLNKKSGVFGLSGNLSSDFRDLEKAEKEGNKLAKLALDTYCYRVAKYVGSYAVAMGGIDVLAFTAGVGENSPRVRDGVCEYLKFMNIPNIMVIPTNEELAIAKQTVELL